MATTTSTVRVETLKALLEAFNAHDVDAIMRFFTDDCSLDMPRGSEPYGRRFAGWDQVREGLSGRFKGIPDVHYGDDRHWIANDRGCSEWLLTGTTIEGKKVAVRGCDLFEFRGEKIVRKDSYWKIVEAVDTQLHTPPTGLDVDEGLDAYDEELTETFPASDPPESTHP